MRVTIHHDPPQDSSSLSSTVANHDVNTTSRAIRIVESKMPFVPLRTLLMHDKAFFCILSERDSEFTEIFDITDIADSHSDFSHQISSYIQAFVSTQRRLHRLVEGDEIESAPAPLLTPCHSMWLPRAGNSVLHRAILLPVCAGEEPRRITPRARQFFVSSGAWDTRRSFPPK